ncbi:hypothetical protein D0Z03_001113 [Geotrichum reessii]|nr:hypothetical protein D0Z03_001113 [Galactomyces reessii]
MAPHPFDQFSLKEIENSVAFIKAQHPGKTIHIKTVEREEPPKALMVPFLEAEKAGKIPIPPPRIAHCVYYVMENKAVSELWVNLNEQKVTQYKQLPKGFHPPIDPWEAAEAQEAAFNHPEVIAAIKKCGLESIKDCLTTDGWMYGCDEEGDTPRYSQLLVYGRDPKHNHPDSNMYAFPVPFVPVYDVLEKKIVRVDWCATGNENDDINGFNYNTLTEGKNIFDTCKGNEYIPELLEKTRDDLKPYNVIQPEGPSFNLQGNLVTWQKWRFRVGFTPREGLVLHDLSFDGRSTFYRLSVSEMAVPYGDPRPPLHRKMAFDFGDCGGGKCANELSLGCDCLGTIKYFSGNICDPQGNAFTKQNVICMHEQDDGIAWKHTNYRTNVPAITRRRILVLQTILTVGNYEYIFAWHLDQAAGIKLEIRATGVVSTQYIDGGKRSKWGTIVSPSVLASSHQHIFSVRMDPAIDNYKKNSVAYCDTKTTPWDDHNPKGTAFYNDTTYIEKSSTLMADILANRYVKIVNESIKNPVSGSPVGYKLHAVPTALLMAQPGSIARKRAAFATKHFWVTKYKDNEFYAGGVWTNQSSKEIGGVQDAVNRNENVRDDDVVLWHSFGLTHHPRVEDFPVMPVEMMSMMLTPYDFFTRNPAIDVPQSTQKFNRSVEVMECRSCHM